MIWITPALAGLMLTHNSPENRPLDEAKVRDMVTGIEQGTLQHRRPLEFRGHTLVNGQHRLSAVIAAGLSAYMPVDWA